ncbi:hypothetical protein RND81_01G081300 [Saponaria officinalis]|uniref:Secreted protein n=1 Tax=Saponaria officinalis TaxID=3572 RepID=A0AAW1NDD2_SAPOF
MKHPKYFSGVIASHLGWGCESATGWLASMILAASSANITPCFDAGLNDGCQPPSIKRRLDFSVYDNRQRYMSSFSVHLRRRGEVRQVLVEIKVRISTKCTFLSGDP